MGQCKRCGQKKFLRSFPRRLDVPELRAMVSHWPWHRVEICPDCQSAFDQEFRTRLLLLAPDVVAQEGDVSEPVCLLCGNQSEDENYLKSGRWINAEGEVVATRFCVCRNCRGQIVANNIISSAELRSAEDFRKLLGRLPVVSAEMVKRNEGWSLNGAASAADPSAASVSAAGGSSAAGADPLDAAEVRRGLELNAAAQAAWEFWSAVPAELAQGGVPVRGAMIMPEKKNAIRTRLELQWRSGQTDHPQVAAVSVYRVQGQFVLVRHKVHPA